MLSQVIVKTRQALCGVEKRFCRKAAGLMYQTGWVIAMRGKSFFVLLGTALLISGCTVYPVHDPRYDYGQTISVAPPPSRYEYSGYPPAVGFVWIGGYWNWLGANYVWVPGRWEAPRPGYYWTPHRWERDGSHWRQSGGRWEHDTRQRVPAPVPRIEHQENLHQPSAPVIRVQPERAPTPERPYVPESRDTVRRPPEGRGTPHSDEKSRDHGRDKDNDR
jgi:hypothetical protein